MPPPPTQPTQPTQPLAPDFDAAHFRQALSQFATGVTVITTRAGAGAARFVGVTASSFNSVSVHPPLVLWSLSLRAASLPLFHAGTHYMVNVLVADQMPLAKRFAYATGDRFAGLDYTLGQSGLPILAGAAAWFECHNRSRYEEGDHVIFVGQVERCGFADAPRPLVFHQRQFSTTEVLPHGPDAFC